MNKKTTCQDCGAILTEDAIYGLCSTCQLKQGFADGEETLSVGLVEEHEIPKTGDRGIPIHDEIVMQLELKPYI